MCYIIYLVPKYKPSICQFLVELRVKVTKLHGLYLYLRSCSDYVKSSHCISTIEEKLDIISKT